MDCIIQVAGRGGVSHKAPDTNIKIKNIGPAGQAGFIQWIVVKTVIKSRYFFDVSKSYSKTKLSFFDWQSVVEHYGVCT